MEWILEIINWILTLFGSIILPLYFYLNNREKLRFTVSFPLFLKEENGIKTFVARFVIENIGRVSSYLRVIKTGITYSPNVYLKGLLNSKEDKKDGLKNPFVRKLDPGEIWSVDQPLNLDGLDELKKNIKKVVLETNFRKHSLTEHDFRRDDFKDFKDFEEGIEIQRKIIASVPKRNRNTTQ